MVSFEPLRESQFCGHVLKSAMRVQRMILVWDENSPNLVVKASCSFSSMVPLADEKLLALTSVSCTPWNSDLSITFLRFGPSLVMNIMNSDYAQTHKP